MSVSYRRPFRRRSSLIALLLMACSCSTAAADEPFVSYIFPAGGQRGTTVRFHVGGHNLHEACPFEMSGTGIQAPSQLVRGATNVWFEGPVIPLPDSQRGEDYPWPQEGSLTIAEDASLGMRRWRVSTSQGVTPSMRFVVGDLPEVIEQEIDGHPIPTPVTQPVTINGRIFPREDVDIWTFNAQAGTSYTCEVLALQLGSPLEAALSVHGPDGEKLAETAGGGDPRMSFIAPVDGTYAVHLHDVNFGGLQHYVYRLTITDGPRVLSTFPLGGRHNSSLHVELHGTNVDESAELSLPAEGKQSRHIVEHQGRPSNTFCLDLSDLPELIESSQNDSPREFNVPSVLNGRIAAEGEQDAWTFAAMKDQQIEFEVRAAQLGSRLDSVLAIIAPDGTQLAENDDAQSGQADSQLLFTSPADGTYQLVIRDAFAGRGGTDFAYRIYARDAADAAPDFALILPSDALTISRGGEAKLKIQCRRGRGFKAPIEIQIDGLPEQVTVSGTTIPENAAEVQLTIKAEPQAANQVVPLCIRGVAKLDETTQLERTATVPATFALDEESEHLMLAVAVPTPFKIVGDFETRYAARGATYLRKYRIDRGGYEGPLTVRLAERQVRHLQGVTGPELIIPAGQNEFDYPIHLAPWMEVGRTSRTCLMGVGELEDSDGRRHKVSYTSHAQNDQIIVLVDPGQMAVRLDRSSVSAAPETQATLQVQVDRGPALSEPVRVELVVPAHVQGLRADPVTLPADQQVAPLRLQFGPNSGPFNMPLIVRATTQWQGRPYTAEAAVTVVPAP